MNWRWLIWPAWAASMYGAIYGAIAIVDATGNSEIVALAGVIALWLGGLGSFCWIGSWIARGRS
jgi:hypothetical protein